MILLLEDDGSRTASFRAAFGGAEHVIVWRAEDAIKHLHSHTPRLVFLDRDLGELDTEHRFTGDGEDVVAWLMRCGECAERFKHTQFIVHSLNVPGGERMVANLRSIGLRARRQPFVWTDVATIRDLVESARNIAPVTLPANRPVLG